MLRLLGSRTMKSAVDVSKVDVAPALGPYSYGIRANGFIYFSGQLSMTPNSPDLVGNDIKTQTKGALENVKKLVEGAGCDMTDVVKTTVLMADMKDFAAMNEVYASFFPNTPQTPAPARSCFAVKELPKSALVEIEAIAVEKK
eukprot:GHVU01026109.1.p1 GENE.GHVU01026109.1~~GHVU01026109.1.p1  ORF type:complete len:143 (+),score=28.66 GHVU01026109.1:421-849(+)